MTIRLKIVRRQEEQRKKVKGLMEMFKLNPNSSSYYQYEPIVVGASTVIDPKIEKVKGLFEMFHLAR
jgi:hypothetical protein